VVRLETLRGIGGAVLHGERLVRVEGVAALPGDDVAALLRPFAYPFLSLSLFRARAIPVGRWWRQPPPRGVQERRRARGHPQNAVAPVRFCGKRDKMRSISNSLSLSLFLSRARARLPPHIPQTSLKMRAMETQVD